ncbi:DUF2796 domain-containing protein [Hyphomicrobium sp. 1Nfss2.1]|uniref:DUF2796 domain-containing protein n=1 Tax=Hyphomicrobium sp. 1Nfss2.1 TaxID=3413936 RepID=UPI003C7E9EEE
MRTHFHSAPFIAAIVLAVVLPTALMAEEGHRELGAHVHGHGTLNIAVEDKSISMELEVPGMDIVGFEHAATSDAQKQMVDEAKMILQRVLEVFPVPAAAECTVASVDVAVEAERHHDEDDHDAKDAKAGDHDHDSHEGHEGHNQFHATYELACSNPSALTSIGFNYFKHFAGAQALTVNLVTSKGQSSYEVSRTKPTLDLSGLM